VRGAPQQRSHKPHTRQLASRRASVCCVLCDSCCCCCATLSPDHPHQQPFPTTSAREPAAPSGCASKCEARACTHHSHGWVGWGMGGWIEGDSTSTSTKRPSTPSQPNSPRRSPPPTPPHQQTGRHQRAAAAGPGGGPRPPPPPLPPPPPWALTPTRRVAIRITKRFESQGFALPCLTLPCLALMVDSID
jgi:hypothetical protein